MPITPISYHPPADNTTLPQDAVCKFFTRLTTRLVLTVPKMVAPMVRPRVRGIPKKWSAGRILGRGAFGECSLAMDHDTGRLLAVKRIQLVGSAREVADSVKALRQEVEVGPRTSVWATQITTRLGLTSNSVVDFVAPKAIN